MRNLSWRSPHLLSGRSPRRTTPRVTPKMRDPGPPLPEEAKPPLVEEPAEDDRHADREYGAYISNMVSRWAGSDYESEDEYAHWRYHRGH